MESPKSRSGSEGELVIQLGDEWCDVSALFTSLGFLTRATHLVERDFIRSSDDRSLPFGTYSALAMIGDNPGIRQGLLGAILQVQESNMAILTKKLMSDKLVSRRPLGMGRRGMGLWLTELGTNQVRELSPLMHQLDRRFASVLDKTELVTLTSLLSRVLRPHL